MKFKMFFFQKKNAVQNIVSLWLFSKIDCDDIYADLMKEWIYRGLGSAILDIMPYHVIYFLHSNL